MHRTVIGQAVLIMSLPEKRPFFYYQTLRRTVNAHVLAHLLSSVKRI